MSGDLGQTKSTVSTVWKGNWSTCSWKLLHDHGV